jgi:hypothetical protein
MGDVLFVVILVAFFALAVVFVRACDRIIGPDLESVPVTETEAAEPSSDVAA